MQTKNNKIKPIWANTVSFMIIFLVIGCVSAFAWSIFSGDSDSASKAQLKNNLVCMVNDKYFGTEQIPVVAEGKTYYGCCQGCVGNIQNNRAVRYARDPYSGVEVDKAGAFIVKNPDSIKQEVLYFESKENFKRYLKTHKK